MHQLLRGILYLLFLLGILLVLDTMESFMVDDEAKSDSEFLSELLLRYAKDLDAEKIRKVLRVSGVNPNVKSTKGGALFLVVHRDEESEAMLASLDELLKHPDTNPNGAGNHWPVLKVAIVKGHDRAVQRLLKHPRTKRVIHPSGLSCTVIERLPEEVSLAEDADAAQCVKDHPRYGSGAKLAAKAAAAAMEDQVNHVRLRDIDWSNPFQPIHKGQRPPLQQYVMNPEAMNPEAFDNIVDAARYYVFGRPWTGIELTVLLTLTAIQGTLGFIVLRRA
ncbi:GPI-anchored surface protein, putative [Bodo saltans]|uniref:GPI-anchored surface protein, putative n=1 Tax=Bodo saltans TaxID=75058 RepID=A0A0S4JM45_BODSA|nr:GPI-anchored surface protein, putative [Bodo saltans]|eukprot:CUG91252.1 GPI-anchored surface protein, putative [Bodo saltans]